MANIASNKVFVFPNSERGTSKPDARIFYEKNTTNLINQLLGKGSFVITPEFDENNPFRFNIKGYYFEISTGQTIIDSATGSGSNIYAAIKIVVNNNLPELKGNDDAEKYTGLDIVRSDTVPTTLDVTYLQLLKLEGTNWVIPDESRIQFIKQNGNTLSNSNLINPTITDGTLTGSTRNEGDLTGGTLNPDSIECSSIHGNITEGSEFSGGFINQSDITGGTIVGSTIKQVSISTVDDQFKTQIGSAELNTDGSIDNANLNNATISGGSIDTIDIANANISGSTISGGSSIDGSVINECTISGGTIVGSTLQDITITAISGGRNYLSSCVITDSEISGSTIDGIDGGEIA